MTLIRANSLTVVLPLAAIPDNASPALTIWESLFVASWFTFLFGYRLFPPITLVERLGNTPQIINYLYSYSFKELEDKQSLLSVKVLHLGLLLGLNNSK